MNSLLRLVAAGAFATGLATSPVSAQTGSRPDEAAWARVRATSDRAELQGFLARFPDSEYAEIARGRLELIDSVLRLQDRELARKRAAELARERSERAAREAQRLKAEAARRRAEEALRRLEQDLARGKLESNDPKRVRRAPAPAAEPAPPAAPARPGLRPVRGSPNGVVIAQAPRRGACAG